MAVPCLMYVGFLQFIDPIAITIWFALTAAGDTKFPAIVDLIVNWLIFVPLLFFAGNYLQEYHIWGPWAAFGLQLLLLASCMVWRIRQGKWKTIEI